MSKVLITRSKLDNLAVAVSAKSGATLPLTIAQMQTAVEDIPTGGATLQAKTNIAPSTSSQTITPDTGYDGLSSVQINAMPSGTAGTPTATKGTVSNHSVSVTPSVTNATGYITGSTKTGPAVTVSASELVSGSQTVTGNGTVDVTNLASVVVNVSGGGSSWTKIAEETYTYSTSSTSSTTVGTLQTGNTGIWTSDKVLYVRIMDTNGKRAGYFYGSHNYSININPINNNTAAVNITQIVRNCFSYTSASQYAINNTSGTGGYGVFAETIYPNGDIRIRARYNSNYSRTIDGTYKVEVYLLDPPTGAPIFT